MIKLLFAAAATVALAASTAYATTVDPITLDGSYEISVTPIKGHGPSITDRLANPFSETLTVGVPTSPVNFFTASPSGTSGINCGRHCGNGNDIASATITVTFSFTDPTGATGNLTETGLYQANYDGTLSCSSSKGKQTDCIDWTGPNNPIDVTFSDGAQVQITLYNAQDWAITPQISFDLSQGTTTHGGGTPVPEPTSLMLFAGSLVAAFGLRRFRKSRR